MSKDSRNCKEFVSVWFWFFNFFFGRMFVEKGSTCPCRSLSAVHTEGAVLPQFLRAIQTLQYTHLEKPAAGGSLCNELGKRIRLKIQCFTLFLLMHICTTFYQMKTIFLSFWQKGHRWFVLSDRESQKEEKPWSAHLTIYFVTGTCLPATCTTLHHERDMNIS